MIDVEEEIEDEGGISDAALILGIGEGFALELAVAGVLPGQRLVQGGYSVWLPTIRRVAGELPSQIERAKRRRFTEGG